MKIKNETAGAYKKALNFIVKLLQAGFSASYAVKFSSKAQKTYLPIKGLAPTPTHRFFAAALAISGLQEHEKESAAYAVWGKNWRKEISI